MNFIIKNKIDIFRIFYILMIALFLIFASMRSRFPFNVPERAIYATFTYIPVALIGIVSLIKPNLPIEAFMSRENEIKPKDYWLQRISGVICILISVTSIIDAWKYVV